MKFLLHISLFILTFITTTLAGVQWLNRDPFDLSLFTLGLPYSLSLLSILLAHEFGHYFSARIHKVSTTLPYFIPIPSFLFNPFGTMGAIIRIRSPLSSKKALFDVGISGPLAGLAVTLAVLLYGFLNLQGIDYLYSIHPEYRVLNQIPETGLTFGNSIFFWVLTKIFSSNNFIPPMNEIYHYPFLCVGWFGLFVTALNLIPVGQLDGGHILYALIGKKQGNIARIFWGTLITMGILGVLPFFGSKLQVGSIGWLIWAAILFFLIKLDHPEVYDPEELDSSRKLLGWVTLAFFLLIFTPSPFLDLQPN